MSKLKTVISGSYGKHLDGMLKLKEFLASKDIEVLAPVSGIDPDEPNDFIIMKDDPVTDPRTLQDSVFAKMRSSSFHIMFNEGGYLGKAAIFELGYAAAIGLQIFTTEEVEDPNLKVYTRPLSDLYPDWKKN